MKQSLLRVPVLCLPAIGVFAVSLAAQQSAGPLVGTALAIAVDGGANGSADATPHVHRNGFAAALVQFPANPTTPDLQAILTSHGAPNLDVDDTSSGRDDIMCDSSGETLVPPMGWGMFSFSFRNGAQGLPGSRLAAEPAADRGASIFTWVLPGSLIPAPLIDTVERSHSRFELQVPGGRDVDALDLPTVLGLDQATLIGSEPGFQTLEPSPAQIYFTVTTATATTAGLVPASWWVYGFGATQPSGATIFRTTKLVGTAGWSVPVIYKPYFELGLLVTEDIDALAIDSNTDTMIVSCVGNQRDQFLYIDASTDFGGTPIPVTKPGGSRVSDAVGSAGNDDVDAVCTLDPRIRSGLYVPDDFGASCGTPRDPFQPALYPVGVSASAYRRFENGQSHYDTWMIGWPPNTGRGPGWAVMVITLGDTVAPAFTALFAPRNPGNAVLGDPIHFSQPIPPAFILSGLPLTFRWFAIDQNGTEVSQAYPVKVFL